MGDDRTYIRVHDGLDENPKVEGLSDAAFRLLVTCWCYSSRNLTDGRITDAAWKKRGTPKARKELIAAGLVEQQDGYVLMHDYLEHQRSAEEIRLLRETRGDSGSYGNHVRWHVVKRKPKQDCEHCQKDGTDPVANGSQVRSQNGRTTIASTETEAEAEVLSTYFEEGGYVRNASESHPPTYADRCPKHAHTAEPGPCGACKDARVANAARPSLVVVRDTQQCLVHMEPDVTHCRGCAADRKAAI